jgi:hypothetical protein
MQRAVQVAEARALAAIHSLHRTPTRTLYHYTGQEGLLGIVNRREIWASHAQYLNDQLEFNYAVGIALEEIERIRRSHLYDRSILDEMQRVAQSSHEASNVCVCSFSEEPDRLSQWRAYGSGFSIGFSGQFLRTVADRERFLLAPCIYDESTQRRLMRDLLVALLDQTTLWGGSLVSCLNRYAPIFKHASFTEEREWRIISMPLTALRRRFDYRCGRATLIPYYRLSLHSEAQPFAIQEIVVGPTPHANLSRRAIAGLLAKHGLITSDVRNTSASYRNW